MIKFDLDKIYPGHNLKRLTGLLTPEYNDGSPIKENIKVPSRGTVFLMNDTETGIKISHVTEKQ